MEAGRRAGAESLCTSNRRVNTGSLSGNLTLVVRDETERTEVKKADVVPGRLETGSREPHGSP